MRYIPSEIHIYEIHTRKKGPQEKYAYRMYVLGMYRYEIRVTEMNGYKMYT
jgi:hypothetical protein